MYVFIFQWNHHCLLYEFIEKARKVAIKLNQEREAQLVKAKLEEEARQREAALQKKREDEVT